MIIEVAHEVFGRVQMNSSDNQSVIVQKFLVVEDALNVMYKIHHSSQLNVICLPS